MGMATCYNSLSFAPKGAEDGVGQSAVSLTAAVHLR